MSKRTFNGLLNVGLENEEDAVVPVMGEETEGQNDPIVDEVLSADETVEAGEGDIIEAEGEVEEAAGALNELETAAEELEDVETALEAFIEEGGMNAQTAIALGITVKRLNRKLGRSPLMNMPSNESFGGTAARLSATKDSLEAVKETKERVIAAIKKWFEIARQALRSFWIKIWDNSPRLKARLESLAKAAERVKGQPKSDTVKVSARDLHIGGKVPDNFVGALKETVNYVVSDMSKVTEFDESKQKVFMDMVKELGKMNDDEFEEYLNAQEAGLKNRTETGVSSDKVKGAPAGYIINFDGPVLVGGKRLFNGLPAEGSDMEKAMGERFGVISASPEADSKAAEIESLPTLSPGDIDKACQEAMRGCDAVTNYRRKYERRDAFYKNMEGMISSIGGFGATSEDDSTFSKAKAAIKIQKAARKLTQSAMGASEQLARHMLAVAKAVGTYGAASLKAYSGEDKETSEAAA